MTEAMKLRELLAEARVRMPQACNYPACNGDGLRACCLSAQIDAALAEPVEGCAECADLRALLDRQSEILAETRTPAEERVSALELDLAVVRDSAYQRGAEAMREAAVRRCEVSPLHGFSTSVGAAYADAVRSLPTPEDKS